MRTVHDIATTRDRAFSRVLLPPLLAVLLSLTACGADGDQGAQDGGTANTASVGTFGDWDADDDATLSQAEFEAAFDARGNFSRWDVDGDGTLSEAELAGGVHDAWDADDDNTLDEVEWSTWTNTWFDEEADT